VYRSAVIVLRAQGFGVANSKSAAGRSLDPVIPAQFELLATEFIAVESTGSYRRPKRVARAAYCVRRARNCGIKDTPNNKSNRKRRLQSACCKCVTNEN
jgi:hypothetical protein